MASAAWGLRPWDSRPAPPAPSRSAAPWRLLLSPAPALGSPGVRPQSLRPVWREPRQRQLSKFSASAGSSPAAPERAAHPWADHGRLALAILAIPPGILWLGFAPPILHLQLRLANAWTALRSRPSVHSVVNSWAALCAACRLGPAPSAPLRLS